METLPWRDAVVFLVAAGLVIPLVKRLRVSPVLAFLLVGLVVGPHGLGRYADAHPWLGAVTIADRAGVAALAELGVVFLLFMIGLELSLARIWRARRLVLGFGAAQVLVSTAVIAAIAVLFGNELPAAVVLGGALALSSTAIVMQLIREQGRFSSKVGYAGFCVLLAQDMAVVPLLFVVGALAASGDQSLYASLALALAQAVLAVAVILGLGRVAVHPFMRLVSAARSPEAFVAATLLIIAITAVTTHSAGMSAALGAFLAGLLFAETPYRHEIEVNIEPFKGLLLGLFFISVGMGMDLSAIGDQPLWIAASVAGLFALKALVTGALALAFGFSRGQALELGLLLGQGGEFAFVALAMAAALALLAPDITQFMLLVVGATMFLTPAVARLARAAGARLARAGDAGLTDPDLSPELCAHVIVVGYGRSGRLLIDLLQQQGIPCFALDRDAAVVDTARRQGAPVFIGDASRGAMLEKLRVHAASALVVSTDDVNAAEQVLLAARERAPGMHILVRARDQAHARLLAERGASAVVSEVLEASLQLGQLMLEATGLPEAAVRELIEERRALEHLAVSDALRAHAER